MTISVVIPVFHEEALINDAITHLESMESDDAIEIIVVDGGTEAETLRVVSSSRVKGIISEKGRGRQMNAGAAAAHGDIVVFLHVDTELPLQGFKEISQVMGTEGFVGGAFDLAIADRAPIFRMIERVASLRSRLTRIPYGDQAIFLKRDYFLEMGGYKDFPLMEDVDLMRRVKKKGGRLCFIDKKVKTSSRRWREEGILTCTLRNWTITLLYLFGVAPERLAKWYL
jgi:rSAM/selenodomain-associated transferase 2